jgi:hypothetical protein
MEPSCREPGIQNPWRARSGETLRACPARRALGVALVLARPAVANWWISNREGSAAGGYSDHPLIRLACDRWQRRDQQLSIRRGSVRSSVLVWNAAARSRIGATAGIERRPSQPSCQRSSQTVGARGASATANDAGHWRRRRCRTRGSRPSGSAAGAGTERPRLGTDAGKCRLIWRNKTTCLSRSPIYPGTFST